MSGSLPDSPRWQPRVPGVGWGPRGDATCAEGTWGAGGASEAGHTEGWDGAGGAGGAQAPTSDERRDSGALQRASACLCGDSRAEGGAGGEAVYACGRAGGAALCAVADGGACSEDRGGAARDAGVRAGDVAMGGRGDGAARVRVAGAGAAAGDGVELQAPEVGDDLRGAGTRGEGEAEGACAGGEQASAGEQSRKRRRGGGAGTRKRVRVSGLGEVVVYVHTGVLRLQDVVVRGSAGEDGGSSATESHTRCESVAGFAISSDGSLSMRGGTEVSGHGRQRVMGLRRVAGPRR